MAYPTFASGDVLNASDMNAVGLWAITPSSVTNGTASGPTVTVGTTVSSVTLNGVFSSDYTDYRVVITAVNGTNGGSYVTCQFGAEATGYYGSLFYDLYTGASNGYGRNNNGASFYVGIIGANNDTNSSFDIHAPNLAKRTCANGTFNGDNYSGWFGGQLANTTQYTDLKIGTSLGTLTGGTIVVYGYRK